MILYIRSNELHGQHFDTYAYVCGVDDAILSAHTQINQIAQQLCVHNTSLNVCDNSNGSSVESKNSLKVSNLQNLH
jgi:hypothetical protein